MKKYLLLIISMVCAVTGAWAGSVTYSWQGNILTLTIDDDADLETLTSDVIANLGYLDGSQLIINGTISKIGITTAASKTEHNIVLNLKEATFTGDNITSGLPNNTSVH